MRTVLAMASACALLTACGDTKQGERAYVARMVGLESRADQSLSAGRLDEARRDLSEAASIPAPLGIPGPWVDCLQRDAYLRLANLELSRGRVADAAKEAQLGLELGTSRDVFAAGLLVARGKAEEAMGRDAEAVRDYHEAQVIDEALLTAERADGGGP